MTDLSALEETAHRANVLMDDMDVMIATARRLMVKSELEVLALIAWRSA